MPPASYDLVRLLCRPSAAEADPGLAAQLQRTQDWAALVAMASEHDVLPLVAHRLAGPFAACIPEELREALSLFNDRQRRRALGLGWQLRQLLAPMAAAGIPVIPLKGPMLGRQIFGAAWLRNIRDLDILVQDKDLARTLDVLAALGYAHDPDLDARQQALLRGYAGQYLMLHPARAPVEPHWMIVPSTLAFGIDHGRLWRSARPVTFRDMPCLEMSAEDTLLTLCLNGAKDRWQQLKPVADVAFLLHAHPGLDWDGLLAAAAAEGCTRVLGVGVLLAARLLQADAPALALQRFGADQAIGRLVRLATLRLAGEHTRPESPYSLRQEYWMMHERARDRWAYALRTALTPRPAHYRRLPLPGRLAWAYHVLKLPWDYALTPARSLTRRLAAIPQGSNP